VGQRVDNEPFRDGYVAGWQSIGGPDSHPAVIPPCQTTVEAGMYMAGLARGISDAQEMKVVERNCLDLGVE
jgi:hypothetical protein